MKTAPNNIVSWEFENFEATREKGFIPIVWDEFDSEIFEGWHGHEAWAVGSKAIVHASIEHVVLNPETMRKKYVVRISFKFKIGHGLREVVYSREPHTEMEIESALSYAEWQATLIFRLIEGDDVKPQTQLKDQSAQD